MQVKVERERVRKAVFEIKISGTDTLGKILPSYHYLAVGGEEPHYVVTKPFWDCDCGDWTWRTGFVCKHLLAALIIEQNPVVIGALKAMGFDGQDNYSVRAPNQQE